jgi:helix-turn-helix protein
MIDYKLKKSVFIYHRFTNKKFTAILIVWKYALLIFERKPEIGRIIERFSFEPGWIDLQTNKGFISFKKEKPIKPDTSSQVEADPLTS